MWRHRTIPQIKEQEKSPEKELNKMEVIWILEKVVIRFLRNFVRT